jgi:hypothetical protein
MPTVVFEPTIPANERPQTYPLDRAATGIGLFDFMAGNSEVMSPYQLRRKRQDVVGND